MALRAVMGEHNSLAAVISWVGSVLYFIAAQGVAVLATIEIGPNLLTAITSIIGAVVLLGQAYLASKVKKIDHVERKAESNRERLDKVEEHIGNNGDE